MNEVCSVLKVNFDSKWKRMVGMVFSWNQIMNMVYPNGNYPFILAFYKRNLDYCHEWSLSHFKVELWFQTKWRVEMVFSWNQSMNIVCPNVNYPFVLAFSRKNLDSFHKWTLSRFKDELWFQTKRRVEMVFFLTKAWISCISMRTTHLSWPLA